METCIGIKSGIPIHFINPLDLKNINFIICWQVLLELISEDATPKPRELFMNKKYDKQLIITGGKSGRVIQKIKQH